MEWQPIETAPKEQGAEIWAYNGEQARMRWFAWVDDGGGALWIYADGLLSDVDPDPIQPTHWMPLPEAPHD